MTDADVANLLAAPRHRFAEFASVDVPAGGGVYAIWEGDCLIYVGIAGRNPSGGGLSGRLRSHANGRRSGNQFCVYVGDRLVLPSLSGQQVAAIGAGALSFDSLIKETITTRFAFSFISTSNYATARAIEDAVKAGALGQAPFLNPAAARPPA